MSLEANALHSVKPYCSIYAILVIIMLTFSGLFERPNIKIQRWLNLVCASALEVTQKCYHPANWKQFACVILCVKNVRYSYIPP